MKIIHIVLGKANPNRMNGVNRVVFELASIQTKQGYNTEVWGLTNSKDDNDIKRPFILKIFRKNKFFLTQSLKDNISALKNENDVIFHIHGAFIYNFYLISKLLIKYNIKYIYTSHGAFNKKAMEKSYILKKLYFNLFEKTILKNAYKVHLIATSEYENISILCDYDINKVLIPNGINTDILKFEFKQITKEKFPIVCYCGRIDIETKGLDILIDGFEHYINNGGDAALWIIGDGSSLSQLKDIVNQKKLSEHVVFYGAKYGEEKLNLIANADAFILTSRNDVFPTSVLEAAGINKPLLLSKETNYGPYVEEYQCGLMLDENNSENISLLFKRFSSLSSDEISEMQISAKIMIDKEFNITSISKKLLEEN